MAATVKRVAIEIVRYGVMLFGGTMVVALGILALLGVIVARILWG